MTPTHWILLAAAIVAWVVFWMAIVPWAGRTIRRRLERRIGESPEAGALDLANRIYTRLVHRVRFEGLDDLPPPFRHGGTGGGIVVANHASGVDPVLVQAGIRRFIRWMMWAEMMEPMLDPVWRAGRILPVRYGAEDSTIVRQAVRWVKDGNLLGIFAEGAIARPAGELRPFQPGVGLIARLTRAPVVLLHVDGAPYTETAFQSAFKPSRATVRLVGVFDLSREKDPQAAVDLLRNALAEHSGWPLNEESLIGQGLEPEPAP